MLNFIKSMKIIQINDHIKINVEMIYSLEYHHNQHLIDEWQNKYTSQLEEFSKDPPLLPISEDEVYKPVFGESIDEEKMKLYGDALTSYIVDCIGECPKYNEQYYVILCTGLKVNLDKTIYDKINEYLEQYIDKEN